MCIAFPAYSSDKKEPSIIWTSILSSPFKMLSFGAFLQLFIGIAYWYLDSVNLSGSQQTILPRDILFIALFLVSIVPMLFYAVMMKYYPLWLRSGSRIMYLSYASYFFIGNFNFLLLLFANTASEVLLIIALAFQLILIAAVFKPLWWLSVWANKKYKLVILIIHSFAFLYWLTCILGLSVFFTITG